MMKVKKNAKYKNVRMWTPIKMILNRQNDECAISQMMHKMPTRRNDWMWIKLMFNFELIYDYLFTNSPVREKHLINIR